MTVRVVLLYALMCLIWGTTWFAIKINLLFFPPLVGVGVRFLVAGLLVLGVAAARREIVPLRKLPWNLVLVLASCLFGLNYVLTYTGETGLSSGLTAVLFGTLPFFTFFYGHHLVNERVGPRIWVGTVLAFGGVAVISLESGARGSWPYVLAVVAASAVSGFANVYAKRHSHHAPLTVLAPAMLIAGIVVAIVGVSTEHLDFARMFALNGVLSLLYLAILGSAIAFFINLWLLKHVAVWVVNFSALIIPVLAVFVGIVFGHETFGLRELAGAAMVVAGMWFALAGDRSTATVG